LQCLSRVLFERLGQPWGSRLGRKEFETLCWKFGIELDEVTSAREMFIREQGKAATQEEIEKRSDEEIYKIEIPANRYDLLCVEGLTQALRTFGWQQDGKIVTYPAPRWKLARPADGQLLSTTVKESILPIRPYVVCAVLRGITFTQDSYDSFIDLQEKLHHNIARKRTLVSIGTHDLDLVEPPFTYEALPKKEIDFLPLKTAGTLEGNLRGEEIEKFYEKDTHIGKYVPLIKDFDSFPVVRDNQGRIMSLPPIINSDFSKISLKTKNVFIEATATDHTKAVVTLNMVCCAFAQHCKEEFTVEPVKVTYPRHLDWLPEGAKEEETPHFAYREFKVKADKINKSVGVKVEPDEMAKLLSRMCLDASPSADGDMLTVQVPPARADVIAECDIIEDVAIAYGYEEILKESKPPQTLSIGYQQPIEKLTHQLRGELASAGYSEMLTFSLCSRDEAFAFCGRKDDGETAVVIENPQTKEFQICRPSLLPGTMKTLSNSRKQPLPFRLFEVTDVVLKDKSERLGCRNERRVCAVNVPQTSEDRSGFENIHGLFEYVMKKLGVKPRSEDKDGYYIEEANDDGCYYPGRQASCHARGKRIGSLGVIHPHVLKAFQFPFPCAYFEITIQDFA